ncbi:Prefoldin subunit 6 [Ceratobasidium theobromae]|uniref:Prefoldin subunit 6 n=1 Tax=Ceratobasidium theobromae TaxID=1582974 RepID=A0A5N5QBY4_9AGAM|nr:Prefoldin subunit 6 [Ceratobasidium theobromae]
MSMEARLQAATTEYQKLQNEKALFDQDLQTAVETRQRLEAQQNENEAVKKEFSSLKSHNVVYKMIGPVLVKQDREEAKGNVDKRLEYIKGEISRVDDHIADLTKKSERKKTEIVTIQNVMQAKRTEDTVAAK